MSVNVDGASQVLIEQLTAKVEKLENELAACRSEQEIGYDDAREMQAKVKELEDEIAKRNYNPLAGMTTLKENAND